MAVSKRACRCRTVRVGRIHPKAAALLCAEGCPASPSFSFEFRRHPGFPRCREGPAEPPAAVFNPVPQPAVRGALPAPAFPAPGSPSRSRGRRGGGGAAIALPRRQGALRRRRAGSGEGAGLEPTSKFPRRRGGRAVTSRCFPVTPGGPMRRGRGDSV